MMAAPSVSLEGKSIWMLQSLPVTPWQVLWAKLSLQLLMTALPALFCTICAMIVCPMTALERLLLVVVPLLYVAMMALVNLTLGLKMPNLHWTSEITPIKQSGGVLLAMLIGFVYSLLQAGYFPGCQMDESAASYLGCYAGLQQPVASGAAAGPDKKARRRDGSPPRRDGNLFVSFFIYLHAPLPSSAPTGQGLFAR